MDRKKEKNLEDRKIEIVKNNEKPLVNANNKYFMEHTIDHTNEKRRSEIVIKKRSIQFGNAKEQCYIMS